ncbi:hypothetical protein ABZ922_44030 [Streptomyces shenzhenensis]|uniref:hypothetical protein n=1 Tax=Streptomyces shenzhenensis TaxID=943815 RepID=UPI0033F99F24
MWTGLPTPPGAGQPPTALAVRDGRIEAVGTAAEALAGAADELLDLGGGLLMPASGDGHCHPDRGGFEALAPDGLFDARRLDAAAPDRPVAQRAWDYHTLWCNPTPPARVP